MVNIYIVQEITLWPVNVGKDFPLGSSLFGAVKLIKNSDPDKYKYSGYGIGFDARARFYLSNGSGFGKNVIIFGTDMSSLLYTGNKKKDIFILGKRPTDGLNDATLAAEKQYSIFFSKQQNKSCLSLNYNGVNSRLYVHCVEI